MLKFVIFGDIVGKTGRKAVVKILPKLKKLYRPDLIIANAENLAHGSGVTPKTIVELEQAGVGVFTGGDHIFAKPDVEKIFERTDCPLIRPANWVTDLGTGEKLITVAKKRVLVVNLIGQVFIADKIQERWGKKLLNPFRVINQILEKYKNEKLNAILVDFHTEATSEQVAMSRFLEGKVSCVFGTHTHIPTADAQILDNGTAAISDIGMTGAKDTILGVDKNIIIDRFLNETQKSFDWPELEKAVVNALYVEINDKTGLAKKIKLIQKEIKI